MRLVLRTIRYLSDNRCFAMTWKLGSFRGNFQTLRTGSTRCITGPTTHSEEVEQVEKSQTLTHLCFTTTSISRSKPHVLLSSDLGARVHGGEHLPLGSQHIRRPSQVTLSQCDNVTLSQCDNVTLSQYDPVTMWQYDPVTPPVKLAWAKHWPLSPSLCYLRYVYVLFFLPSIACRHLSSVPEHPWASPIKKLSFFIQRTSGDFA